MQLCLSNSHNAKYWSSQSGQCCCCPGKPHSRGVTVKRRCSWNFFTLSICTRRTLFKSGDLGESKKGKKEGASSCEKRTELGEGPASVTKIWEHQTLEFFKIFIFRTLNLLIKTV